TCFRCPDNFGVAPDQPDPLAAGDLAARSRNRSFQKAQPAFADTLRQASNALGVASARAKHDFGRALARGRQELPFDHVLDLIGAEHRNHDGIAAPREIANGGGSTAAELRELDVFGAVDVEAYDREAGAKQAAHKCLAQQAEANHADSSVTSVTRRFVLQRWQPSTYPGRPSGGHQPGGAMASPRGAASRLSRSGLGPGMPFFVRSCRLRWLCSPGSQMRSPSGNRSAPRITRTAAS